MSRAIAINIDDKEQPLQLGFPIKGKIVVTAFEDIADAKLTYAFSYELRGKLSIRKEVLDTGILHENISFQKGHPKAIPFDIIYDKIPSYSGINAELIIRLEVYVIINIIEKSKNKKWRSIKLSHLKGFWSNQEIKYSNFEFLNIKKQKNTYQIEQTYSTPTVNMESGDSILFLLFPVTITFLFLVLGLNSPYVLIGLFIFILLCVITYVALGDMLMKPINIAFSNLDGEKFKVQLNSATDWQLKNLLIIKTLDLYLEIIEAVTDNRGTTNSTYKEQLYRSEERSFSSPQDAIEEVFSFPKNCQNPFSIRNLSVKWRFVIHAKTNLGISFYLHQPLKIE